MPGGSDRHSPREDDALEAERRGTSGDNGPSRPEERHDPELPADDEADVPPLGGGA